MAQRAIRLCLFCLVWAALSGEHLCGVVVHPSGDPDVNEGVVYPSESLIGRWGGNASCVAIGPNYILTTRHQGGGIGTVVEFDGEAYTVLAQWNAEEVMAGQLTDLRVCRIGKAFGGSYLPANLPVYAQVLDKDNEVGQTVWVGGYGKHRGSELMTQGQVYAYQWAGSDNTQLHWGQNIIDGMGTFSYGSYAAQLLNADFDDPERADATALEGIIAEYDSGGSWLIEQDGVMKVAALNATVEQVNVSQFRSGFNPNVHDPDRMYGVRLNPYYQWINDIVAAPGCLASLPGDADGDCQVDTADLMVVAGHWLSASGETGYDASADVNTDGLVNLDDLAVVMQSWLMCNKVPQERCD